MKILCHENFHYTVILFHPASLPPSPPSLTKRHNLPQSHPKRPHICPNGVGVVQNGLQGHPTEGQPHRVDVVTPTKGCHPKIGHFDRIVLINKHITAGKISMDDPQPRQTVLIQ